MKSRFADKFNHDDQAAFYDRLVRAEDDPIRAGYEQVLEWVVSKAGSTPECTVLDLGAGTGNLAQRLSAFKSLVCVDISEKMLGKAREKLASRRHVSFVAADLLEYFDGRIPLFDRIVSTYAVHHLTEEEKLRLFGRIVSSLRDGGVAAFGDLMFESAREKQRLLRQYEETGRSSLIEEIEDEFFWFVDTAVRCFEGMGCTVETRRFSELSWGVSAKLVGR